MKDIPMMERTFKAFRDAGQGDQRFANYTNMLEKKLEKAKAEAKQ
jgi:hypothetical protein